MGKHDLLSHLPIDAIVPVLKCELISKRLVRQIDIFISPYVPSPRDFGPCFVHNSEKFPMRLAESLVVSATVSSFISTFAGYPVGLIVPPRLQVSNISHSSIR